MKRDHAYVGCIFDRHGYVGWCKCGYHTRAYGTKPVAQGALHAHIADGNERQPMNVRT